MRIENHKLTINEVTYIPEVEVTFVFPLELLVEFETDNDKEKSAIKFFKEFETAYQEYKKNL
jgi:hypothetical protein